MPSEVEIKFAIPDLRALERRLRRAGFRLKTRRTHETNTLYDLPDASLRNRGEVLRLRQYGEDWKLTHKSKGTAARHKTREELETGVADGKQMDAILCALGYQPCFRYEKFRSEWQDSGGHVVLDETPIGNIGEIEGKPRWIDRTAKALGIQPADYITDSYVGLFFKWKAQSDSPAENMTFKEVRRARRVQTARS